MLEACLERKTVEKVTLRIPALDDAEALFARIDESRATLRAWLPWVDASQSADDTREFLKGITASLDREGGVCTHRLIEVDGRIAGIMDIHGISKINRFGYIGYWLADRYVGRGILQQALAQLLDIGFGELELNRLCIDAAVENHRSCAVAERAGFQFEGVLREYLRLHERQRDAKQYSLLASEWRARRCG